VNPKGKKKGLVHVDMEKGKVQASLVELSASLASMDQEYRVRIILKAPKEIAGGAALKNHDVGIWPPQM
jgi:hypothetical protein